MLKFMFPSFSKYPAIDSRKTWTVAGDNEALSEDLS